MQPSKKLTLAERLMKMVSGDYGQKAKKVPDRQITTAQRLMMHIAETSSLRNSAQNYEKLEQASPKFSRAGAFRYFWISKEFVWMDALKRFVGLKGKTYNVGTNVNKRGAVGFRGTLHGKRRVPVRIAQRPLKPATA